MNAVDAAGNASDPSNNANATTPAQPDTTKPTAPTFLAAIANTTNAQINLTWNASTDNVGVLGYKVYRRVTNSGQSFAQIGVTVASVTSFGDATVTLGTSYDYVVTAIDPSGNESAQSNQVSYALPVPPPTIETLTFSPSDDATIRKQYPAKNYGSVSTLSLNAKPVADYMMKFNVAGVKGRQVLSAQLRLYNTQGSVNGGTYTLAGSNNWTEAAVTWNTAPAAGPTIGALGSVAKGKYFVVDLVNTVNADGTYSLRVNTPSTDNAVYSSKEANNKPQLILTVQ